MKERPILFQGEMVRAILRTVNPKTQTRRALKVQPIDVLPMNDDKRGKEWVGLMTREPEPKGTVFRCKFGQPGDRLWVRETWCDLRDVRTDDPGLQAIQTGALYRADYPGDTLFHDDRPEEPIRWRPSIHMPRHKCRTVLDIVNIRVERLQAITESDAIKEGVTICERHANGYCAGEYLPPAVRAYRELWEAINGAGSWDANPWVWVIEFRRTKS